MTIFWNALRSFEIVYSEILVTLTCLFLLRKLLFELLLLLLNLLSLLL